MKCNECKNFKVQRSVINKNDKDSAAGTCTISNAVCDPGDECKTGLFDKLSAI